MTSARSTILHALLSSLLITSCAPVLQATVPTTEPAAPTIPAAVSPPPATPATAPPPAAAAPTVAIAAALQGKPLVGAAVTVRLAKDLSILATGLTADAGGRVILPLAGKLQPGAVVVVQAETKSASLSGIFAVPDPAFAIKQTAPAPEWLLDLATSVATRKLTSKIAEVVRSAPAGTTSDGIKALLAQAQQLVQQTRTALATAFQDERATKAAATAAAAPTSENIESLANSLVRYSPLRYAFTDAVDACNRQVVTNLLAGGPLVLPAHWQIAEVQVTPPNLQVTSDGKVSITYRDQTGTVTVPNAAAALSAAGLESTATTSNTAFANVNTTFVPAPSTGGGGGGAVVPAEPSGITTFAGTTTGFSGDGAEATAAQLSSPSYMAFDSVGNFYVCDMGNARIRVVCKTPGTYFGVAMTAGNIYTICGTTSGFSGDGAAATAAKINNPRGMSFDTAGNLYFADFNNNRIRAICKTDGTYFGVAMTAGNIYTVAGTTAGLSGDEGPALDAKLSGPHSARFDAAGNLYIPEWNNNRIRVVCKTDGTYFGVPMTAGNIYTVAGTTAGLSGDGGAALNAQLSGCTDVRFDAAGNLYFTDTSNSRIRVVCKTPGTYFGVAMTANNIYTVAGTTSGFSGDGAAATAAQITTPYGLDLDANGNIYIPDSTNHRVRVVCKTAGTYFSVPMTAGNIYTIAGSTAGTSGDGGDSLSALFSMPWVLTFDATGKLYVSQGSSPRIRKLVP